MADGVWVVVQQREGQLHRSSREAISAAQELAAELGLTVQAVVLGSGVSGCAGEVSSYDLNVVKLIDHPALAAYTPGAYVGALGPVVLQGKPPFVIFPHTYQTVDFMARLAQATGAGLLPEVTGFKAESDGLIWRRPMLGGKMEARLKVRGTGTMLISIQSGVFAAESARRGQAIVERIEAPGELKADREILGTVSSALEKIDLTKAEVIVAAGRGVGGADKMAPIVDLAAALGAEIAASRPVIDNGWLPRDRQIGSSGQTVAPRLYIAAGISGAIQHTVGMKGSQVIVAINKDPGAPIFNIARYGLVGDLHELLPAITKAVLEARG